MENYVLPPAEERGERYDKKFFDAISDLLMAQAQSIRESIAHKQFEKFDKLESSEQKQIMQELAEIKEEFYAEFLPSVVSAENREYIDLESEQVQKLYEEYVALKIAGRISEGSVLGKIELTTEEKRELLIRDPASMGTILKGGAILLSMYGTYETAIEVSRVKGEFEKYKEKSGKESFIDFYNENPDEFDSLATEAVLTMAYPALKAVKYLAKYGTKVALRVVDSAGKLKIKTKNGIAKLGKAMTAKKVDPFKLNPTHKIRMSKKKFIKFKEQLKQDGMVRETVKYVEHNGTKYIVDGHHRVRAAKELGMKNIPVEKVKLPFKGYESVDDLLIGGM
jgi:hypothetical protein